MADRSGFFKGEKKKKKAGGGGGSLTFAPVFTPPEIIQKGKKEK